MTSPDTKSPAWRTKQEEICRRLDIGLRSLGLIPERDYLIVEPGLERLCTLVFVYERELVTPQLLAECNKAVVAEKDKWRVYIDAYDPKVNDFASLIGTSAGAFWVTGSDDAVRDQIAQAYELLGGRHYWWALASGRDPSQIQ